jgi:heme exporter protein CcmB
LNFILLRTLQQSELGWFGEVRRQGRETSRQRALNIDATEVERMFPMAIGPQREWLQRIGPGVIWVAALLSVILALPRLFEHDHADGTLDAMVASGRPLWALIAGKLIAAWLVYEGWLSAAAPGKVVGEFPADREKLAVLVAHLHSDAPSSAGDAGLDGKAASA